MIGHDNNILGGTSVFAGTRVPVQTLLDYLEGDEAFYVVSAITTIARSPKTTKLTATPVAPALALLRIVDNQAVKVSYH